MLPLHFMLQRIANLQSWLNAHGASLAVDGLSGPATRLAIIETFRNRSAEPVTPLQINLIAARLGCTSRQLNAFAQVEGGGSGWDNSGLLKCLYERHYLWRRIKVSVPLISDPKPGGYTIDADRDGINDSWEKLADAALAYGFNIAAECASFGKFQIMGAHWKALGYPSVAEFIWDMSREESAHYEAFARFITVNKLADALRKVDGDPENARAIAKGYNGGGYEKFSYHEKIAAAWRRG